MYAWHAATLNYDVTGSQIKLKAFYEDPDNLQQYTPKKDDIDLEECSAYVEKKKGEIKIEEMRHKTGRVSSLC